MNEEERDLEAELKKETDRFHNQNQEAYDKEVSGENEIKAAYEKNRERLKKTREESADPDRFQSQLETIKNITPDLSDPKEASEFFTDMAVDAGIIGRSLGEDLPAGIALVISRRLAKSKNVKKTIEDGIGKVAQIADEIVEPENGLSIIEKMQTALSPSLVTPDGIKLPAPDDFTPTSVFAASENPIEKFGKKLGKQVQKAVDETKQGVQRVLGRKADNIEVEPGFEAFALDPASKEAQRVLLDAIARKSGYKSLGDFKKNVINKYPDPQAQEQLIYKFSKEGYGVGQIEHKTAKSSKKARKAKIIRQNPNLSAEKIDELLASKSKNTYDMDWYWDTEYIGRDGKLYTDGLGKGDRDGIFNTEITFDARRISLKNVVEGIGYGGEGKGGKALAGKAGALVEREGLPPGILVQSPRLEDRIIVTIENTGNRKNIINRVGQLGNIRLRRAGDNRLLGEIGDYVDALYPKTEEAKDLLIRGLEAKGITDVAAWRRDLIYERLKAIVDGQTSLPKTEKRRVERITARLQKDMTDLYAEYPFLRPQKQVFDEVTAGIDADQVTRGQRSGPFLTKTEERQIQQSKLRKRPLPIPEEEILTQQEFDFD